jgi:hypothetical protein
MTQTYLALYDCEYVHSLERLAEAAIARSDAFKVAIPEEERTKAVLAYDDALAEARAAIAKVPRLRAHR